MTFRSTLLIVVALVCTSSQNEAFSQRVVYVPGRVHWTVYDPYRSVTSRIYAQSSLIRAQGSAAVSFSIARNLHAAAYAKELENWKEEVRAYWDRKMISQRKQMEYDHVRQIARMKYLNDKKWTNNRTWERLKNHPELSDTSIKSGAALNFLLDRLTASALPYEFDPNNTRFGEEALREISLDDDWLGDITLAQGNYQFQANQRVQEEIDLWPYLLRWEQFEEERQAFESARKTVLEESEKNGEASVESIRRMQDTLLLLANAFHRSTAVKSWVREHLRFSQFNAVDRFLHNLDREIVRLEETGDIRPFQGRSGYDPKVDGKHVISLLSYMNRNGIEFGPAQPGNEYAYHDLFTTMRAIYLTVADEDESIQPKDLSKEK